jgi:hypothetical protein
MGFGIASLSLSQFPIFVDAHPLHRLASGHEPVISAAACLALHTPGSQRLGRERAFCRGAGVTCVECGGGGVNN